MSESANNGMQESTLLRRLKWAWGLILPALEQVVLFRLIDYANADGICWPGVDTLARACQLSARTIRYALDDLAGKGVLRIESARGRGNRYMLQESCTVVAAPPGRRVRPVQGEAPRAGVHRVPHSKAPGASQVRHRVQQTKAPGASEVIQEVIQLEVTQEVDRARDGDGILRERFQSAARALRSRRKTNAART